MVKLVFTDKLEKVDFDTLIAGDGFLLYEEVYIKINPEMSDYNTWVDENGDETNEELEYNALNLSTMALHHVSDEEVFPVSLEVKVG